MTERALAVARNPWARGLLVLAVLAAAILAIWWRGPEWGAVVDAFDAVTWRWVIVAVLLNLVSTLARSLSWRLTINQALPEPHPSFGQVFSAFGIGLLGNAVLPARGGALARVAVLRRHLPHGKGTSATLLGTVFAHRLFDLFPVALLFVWVLLTAKIPHWAVTSLIIFGLVGVALLAVGLLSARTGEGRIHDGMGSLRSLVLMARQGLAVLRRPLPALGAILCQCVGWLMQLFAVWAVMEAFNLDLSLPAAGLVLLLMNVAIIFPLWPGNVGLLQAAVALPLGQYGVAYATGFAYGLVLQAVEMSVGVAVGLVFLAREGLSLASLKAMEEEQESEENAVLEAVHPAGPTEAGTSQASVDHESAVETPEVRRDPRIRT
jgi:glycosyltransferase 2 family protein